jgi:1-acyl-sn-glycerol-3-phosphate acyltransferase
MVIVLVFDQYGNLNNGTTVSGRRFAEALRKRGHEVRVVGVGKGGEEGFYPVAERYIPLVTPVSHLHGMLFGKPDGAVLRKALEGADIVHFLLPYKLAKKGGRIAREMGVPATAAFHMQPENVTWNIGLGKLEFVNRFIYRHLYHTFYRRFDDIHCPSRFIAGELRKHGYHQRLHVISNGVEASFSPGRDERPEAWKDRFVILSIGRYAAEKRQDTLIRAAAMSQYTDRIQLVLAGGGPRERRLRRLAKRLKNPPVFGFFSRDELVRLARSCDLYVHAAECEIEGISCIEAFACGAVPLIARAPKSATYQFALDESSIFEGGDASDLARHIDFWIENPVLRQAMSLRYARHAVQYGVDDSVRQIEAVFERAAREKRESRPAAPRREEGPDFIPSNIFVRFISRLAVLLALMLLSAFDRVAYGMRLKGLRNIRGLRGGYVTLCNHVHPMDSTMVAVSLFPRRVYFPTLEANARLPVAGLFVRALGGIPIPRGVGGLARFFQAMERVLERGQCVHFFPEGELEPYGRGLRPFKNGAFYLALRQRVPVVPMVVTYREPKGISRLWRKKPMMTLRVGKPIYSIESEPTPAAEECLKQAAWRAMEQMANGLGCGLKGYTEVAGDLNAGGGETV